MRCESVKRYLVIRCNDVWTSGYGGMHNKRKLQLHTLYSNAFTDQFSFYAAYWLLMNIGKLCLVPCLYLLSGGSRISQRTGANLIFLPNFPQRLHENEKKLDPVEDSSLTPPDLPMLLHMLTRRTAGKDSGQKRPVCNRRYHSFSDVRGFLQNSADRNEGQWNFLKLSRTFSEFSEFKESE